MQIDFHYSVVYVIARLAGFRTREANIVAYASQYVDDSVRDDTVWFDNGAIYKPVCSAHKELSYKNFDKLADHLVWVPYHFLPANGMFPAGANDPGMDFVSRIICRPNSYIARDMIEECIKRKGEPNSLHRLGVTLHVYADTWAHQGFAGIISNVNRVEYIADNEAGRKLLDKVKDFFGNVFDNKMSSFVDNVEPLGHGSVLSYPDRPYLKWSYKDYKGNEVIRDNTKIYIEAVKNIYKVLVCYLKKNLSYWNVELNSTYIDKFTNLFERFTDSDGEKRNAEWLNIISNNEFGFGFDSVEYKCDGPSSWEYIAFGGNRTEKEKCMKFTQDFMDSDWKKFNDALIDHQYFLLRVLFPKYGLCIA